MDKYRLVKGIEILDPKVECLLRASPGVKEGPKQSAISRVLVAKRVEDMDQAIVLRFQEVRILVECVPDLGLGACHDVPNARVEKVLYKMCLDTGPHAVFNRLACVPAINYEA